MPSGDCKVISTQTPLGVLEIHGKDKLSWSRLATHLIPNYRYATTVPDFGYRAGGQGLELFEFDGQGKILRHTNVVTTHTQLKVRDL